MIPCRDKVMLIKLKYKYTCFNEKYQTKFRIRLNSLLLSYLPNCMTITTTVSAVKICAMKELQSASAQTMQYCRLMIIDTNLLSENGTKYQNLVSEPSI